MAKQLIGLGSSPNDGTGDNLRVGGDKVNDNFNEIYTAIGDGTTLTSGTFITTTSTNILTNKSIDSDNNTITNIVDADIKSSAAIANSKLANSSISIGGVTLNLGDTDATPALDLSDATSYPTSSLTGTITNAQLDGSIANSKLSNNSISIIADDSSAQSVALGGSILFTGGSGITTSISGNEISFVTDGSIVTETSTDTLTNKSIDLTDNTITGTTAEFNTALSDGSFATLAGSEVLTNKTINGPDNTLTNIANSSLANTAVTLGATSVALGATIGSASNFNLSGTSSISGSGTVDTTGAGNKLRFNVAYADAAALGSAIDPSTYEGMFAYNTTDNKAYVADTGGWVRLFDENISVGDISNVDLSGISNGQILAWDSGDAKFVATSAGTFSAGSDLDQAGADVQDVGYVSHRSPDATVTQTLTVTVATKTTEHTAYGDGSSSGYLIDGHEGAHLSMTPGVYKFDQADSSNSGHPLLFYREAAKTTAYTTNVTTSGTPGSSGAHTTITITKDTPQVLHYQCSAHANMGGVLTNIGSEANLGITHADQWRLTSAFTGDQLPLLNLEQNDNPSFTAIGTAMSFSSGIFTFPVTGIWLVSLHTEHYMNGNDREINGRIQVTQNNSTYVQVARGAGFINGVGSNTHTSTECSSIVDVTDTANVKVQFGVATDQLSTTISDTNQNVTFMTFVRLGDT